MLRKLKQQVSQAVNAVNSNETRHEVLVNEEGPSSEGFLCPMCMSAFGSADQLQVHFTSHMPSGSEEMPQQSQNCVLPSPPLIDIENGCSATSNTNCESESAVLRMAFRDSELSFEGKKNMVAGLAADEDSLNSLTRQIDNVVTDNVRVTRQVADLLNQKTAFTDQMAQMAREKEEIVAKLGELTTKLTLMTEELEEKQSEKEVLGNELLRYRDEIKKLEARAHHLEKQLDQRPSEDDVNVLRLELVHAQQLMDKVTLEKEEEISEHLQSIRSLNLERQQGIYVAKNLEEQNVKLKEEMSRLESEGKLMREKCATLELEAGRVGKECDAGKANAENARTAFENEKSVLIEKLATADAKIAEMKQIEEESCKEIARCSELNEANVRRLHELQQKLDQMGAEKARYEEDIRRLEEEREREVHERSEALEKISTLQKSANSQKDELIEELAEVKNTLEKEKKLCAEKNIVLNEKLEELRNANDEIAELKDENSELGEYLKKLTTEDAHLKEKLQCAEQAILDLAKKEAAGEDCSKRVIELMVQEKRQLLQTVEEVENKCSSLEKEMQKNKEGLQKEHAAKLRSLADKNSRLGQELEQVRAKYALSEEENKKKSKRFAELEEELETRIEEYEATMKQKREELSASNVVADDLRMEVTRYSGLVRELERVVENNRTEITEAVRKLAVMEEKAKTLDDEIRLARDRANEALEKKEEALALLQQKDTELARFSSDLQKAKSMLEEAEEWKNQAEAEAVHTSGRISDLERVVKQGVEQNDELISKLSELQNTSDEYERNLKSATQSLHEKTTANKQLCAKVAQLEDSVAAATEKIAKCEEHCTTLINQLDESNAETQRSKKCIAELNATISSKDSLIVELESRIGYLCEEGNLMKSDFETKLLSAEEKHSELERLYSEAVALLKDKEQETMKHLSRAESLEELLRSKETEIGDFSERLIKFEEDLSEKRRTIEDLENSKSKLEEKVAQQATICSELEARGKERETTLLKQIESLKSSLSAASADNTKLKAQVQSCEECAILLKKDFERQLGEANDSLKKSMEENASIVASLRAEIADKCREKDVVQEALQAKEEEIGELTGRFELSLSHENQMRHRCEELERKIANVTEERESMTERYHSARSDLDFEKERAAENKRRFDEMTSALHELGRANQSLQMDMSKHFNRKWLDDSEAMNCNSCGKPFSLTLRKHHCRNCGLIFCKGCSSRTAQVPSQKVPVRVCIPCHEDLSHR